MHDGIILSVAKRRIDLLLVDRGLAESLVKARAMVMAGDVMVDGKMLDKPGMAVAGEADITLAARSPFVGRGGIKLDYALDSFGLNVAEAVAADVGSSTGGFTDCLLKRGASRVYAVDVGKGQLDWRLRNDARVVSMEGVNARFPLDLPEKVDLATIDVSFISVQKVIPSIAERMKAGGHLVVLVKPQFEALRREVGRGGVINDPGVHSRVLGRLINWLTAHGLRLRGLTPSPIRGAAGNMEFLVLVRWDGGAF